MARAIAFDLLNYEPKYQLIILDREQNALDNLSDFCSGKDLMTVKGDASDKHLLRELMQDTDAAIGASSYKLHYIASMTAIEEKCHWVDLGGNPTVVQQQFALHEQAKTANVGVVPDAGLAPGFVNVIGGYLASRFDEVSELHFRVGGLPQNPKPPLFYGLVFSPEGLANEYYEPAWVIENGEVRAVESLTGWERVHFNAPLGNLEAFHTSGGASTMVDTFRNSVRELDYKTLRYPGHLRKIKLLGDLGFWGETPLKVRCKELGAECTVSPRDVMGAMLMKSGFITDDLVALIAWGIGRKDGVIKRIEVKMLDYADPVTGLSAMARTTGFPATIICRLLVEGSIMEYGVLRQEVSVPAIEVFNELLKRGVKVEIAESVAI